jgi:hypothetical protein
MAKSPAPLDRTATDEAWADPAWAVDSATRHCCGGIGDHTAECDVPATLAAITAPVDAQHVEDWRDDFDTGDYDRYFRGTRRSTAGVELTITGFQDAEGITWRNVHILAADVHLDAAGLRRHAAQVLAAAAELDELKPIAYTLTDPTHA